jgi:hypothetical protein
MLLNHRQYKDIPQSTDDPRMDERFAVVAEEMKANSVFCNRVFTAFRLLTLLKSGSASSTKTRDISQRLEALLESLSENLFYSAQSIHGITQRYLAENLHCLCLHHITRGQFGSNSDLWSAVYPTPLINKIAPQDRRTELRMRTTALLSLVFALCFPFMGLIGYVTYNKALPPLFFFITGFIMYGLGRWVPLKGESGYHYMIKSTVIEASADFPEGPSPLEYAISGKIFRSLGLGSLFFASGITTYQLWPYWKIGKFILGALGIILAAFNIIQPIAIWRKRKSVREEIRQAVRDPLLSIIAESAPALWEISSWGCDDNCSWLRFAPKGWYVSRRLPVLFQTFMKPLYFVEVILIKTSTMVNSDNSNIDKLRSNSLQNVPAGFSLHVYQDNFVVLPGALAHEMCYETGFSTYMLHFVRSGIECIIRFNCNHKDQFTFDIPLVRSFAVILSETVALFADQNITGDHL